MFLVVAFLIMTEESKNKKKTRILQMDALFEITYEKEFTCPICMGAKVPYSTLSPCGHSLCAPCAEKCQQCPECRAAIVTHTVSVQLAELVANHAHYQCNGCHQGGGHSFAQQHRCDQMMSALLKQLEDAKVAMAAVVDGHKTQIEEYEAQVVAANDSVTEMCALVKDANDRVTETNARVTETNARLEDANDRATKMSTLLEIANTTIQSLLAKVSKANAKGGDDEVPVAGGPPANASAKNERASPE